MGEAANSGRVLEGRGLRAALGQHGGLGLVLRRLSQSYPQLHERNDIRVIYSCGLVLNRRKPWTIRGGTGPRLAQMTQPLCRKGILNRNGGFQSFLRHRGRELSWSARQAGHNTGRGPRDAARGMMGSGLASGWLLMRRIWLLPGAAGGGRSATERAAPGGRRPGAPTNR